MNTEYWSNKIPQLSEEKNIKDFLQKAEMDYELVRVMTWISWIYNLYRWHLPYFPYWTKWTTDSSTNRQTEFLLIEWDNLASIIDLKHLEIEALKEKVNALITIFEQHWYDEHKKILLTAMRYIKKSVWNLNNKAQDITPENHTYNNREKAIFQALYHMSWEKKEEYFSCNEQWLRTMNEIWRKSFSEKFYSILEWLESLRILEQYEIFWWSFIDEIVKDNKWTKMLAAHDIIAIINYLKTKTDTTFLGEDPCYAQFSQENLKNIANSIDSKKAILLDYVYTLHYAYEKYNIDIIKEIFEDNNEMLETMHTKCNEILNKLRQNPANEWNCLVQIRPKSDISIATKMLNKRIVKLEDLIWFRIYLNSDLYRTNDDKKTATKHLLANIKPVIDSIFEQSYYTANYTKLDTKNTLRDIKDINRGEMIEIMYTNLQIQAHHEIEEKKHNKQSENKKSHKEWMSSSIPWLDDQEIMNIINSISQKKPWDYWDYQHLKCKFWYTLQKKHEKNTSIDNNPVWEELSLWWIELQIWFYNHTNESHQASHIFFDRVKYIRAFSREKSNIWLDDCWNLYKWVFSKMVHKMRNRKNEDYSWYNKEYVDKQFDIENKFHIDWKDWEDWEDYELHEFFDKHKWDTTAVIKKLFTVHMKQLIEWWDLVRFAYDNDLKTLWIDTSWKIKTEYDFPQLDDIINKENISWRYKYRFVTDPKIWIIQWTIPTNSQFYINWHIYPTPVIAQILFQHNDCSRKQYTTISDIQSHTAANVKKSLIDKQQWENTQ